MMNISKSWLYALGLSALFLLMLLINSPAQLAQKNELSATTQVQLVRGGNFLIPAPRRTQATQNAQNQSGTESSKDSDKAQRGLQEPADKTSVEEGPSGTKKQSLDMNQA